MYKTDKHASFKLKLLLKKSEEIICGKKSAGRKGRCPSASS